MAQPNNGDVGTIDPTTTSGTDLAALLSRIFQALYSQNSGPTKTPGADVGLIWADTDDVNNSIVLKVSLPTGNAVLATINVNNGKIEFDATYSQQEVDAKIAQAVGNLSGGVVTNVRSGAGIDLSKSGGDVKVSHSDTSSESNAPVSGLRSVMGMDLDEFGHVIKINRVDLSGEFYTQGQADGRFLLRNEGLSKGDAAAIYATRADTYSKSTSDNRFMGTDNPLSPKAAGWVGGDGKLFRQRGVVTSAGRDGEGLYYLRGNFPGNVIAQFTPYFTGRKNRSINLETVSDSRIEISAIDPNGDRVDCAFSFVLI